MRYRNLIKWVLVALVTCHLSLVTSARAQNVFVTNGSGHPVPVVGTISTTSDGTTVAVPGATPSSSPAKAVIVQGINGATAIGIGGYTDSSTIAGIRVANINKDLNTVTITTITTVWTPTSGKKFRLMGGSISVSAAASVLFEDNTATNTVYRTPKLAADTPYNFVVNGGQGFVSSAANNVLKATASAAGAITGTIWGTEE